MMDRLGFHLRVKTPDRDAGWAIAFTNPVRTAQKPAPVLADLASEGEGWGASASLGFNCRWKSGALLGGSQWDLPGLLPLDCLPNLRASSRSEYGFLTSRRMTMSVGVTLSLP